MRIVVVIIPFHPFHIGSKSRLLRVPSITIIVLDYIQVLTHRLASNGPVHP